MQQSDIPPRFLIPFADGAGAGYIRAIPQAHQAATSTDAPASLFDGFPPETFLPEASGGIPPNGKDFNGILNWLSLAVRWAQAGGPVFFDAALSSAIGGYPKGAVLASAATDGLFFVSQVNNNTADPDVNATNWQTMGATKRTIAGSAWRRVNSDGWIETGGVAAIGRSTEGNFTLTFPQAFPNACLGVVATVINSSQSNTGQTTIQEVSLSAGSALLYAQNHQSSLVDIAGGIRWRAWGY
ncbi:gp53-like domain-containing protein [Novosphingobium olei]|uniref:Putative tail fiber protein gp53-like C-terminal domain-containing protein n=1 Tax=Novosphingobium olei TaxID=2728851 RepID=A0A7Y0BNX2_9SPHN|nr:hypothetical protein [Novosphingobium olei]NML93814.1 hypothetical protein [Novosphingobium olei]